MGVEAGFGIMALLAMVTLVAILNINFSEASPSWFGKQSAFKALVCAVVFTEYFLFFYKFRPYETHPFLFNWRGKY